MRQRGWAAGRGLDPRVFTHVHTLGGIYAHTDTDGYKHAQQHLGERIYTSWRRQALSRDAICNLLLPLVWGRLRGCAPPVCERILTHSDHKL